MHAIINHKEYDEYKEYEEYKANETPRSFIGEFFTFMNRLFHEFSQSPIDKLVTRLLA